MKPNENLNKKFKLSSKNFTYGGKRPNMYARKFTFVTDVIVKQKRVLVQQCNQQSGESQQMECEVLTVSGQPAEDSSGQSEREPTDGRVCGIARGCRREKWTK